MDDADPAQPVRPKKIITLHVRIGPELLRKLNRLSGSGRFITQSEAARAALSIGLRHIDRDEAEAA